MRRNLAFLFVGLSAFAVSLSAAQSLGDLARAQRQKQQQKKDSAKVITDEDVPKHDDPLPSKDKKDDSAADGLRSAKPAANTAEEWKTLILNAKERIAAAQQRLDEYKASIHFVEANGYSNGAEYNQYQARKLQESERAQKQLDQAKEKLEELQEACRKAGFGSAVYDP